jgi:hypothetical protein
VVSHPPCLGGLCGVPGANLLLPGHCASRPSQLVASPFFSASGSGAWLACVPGRPCHGCPHGVAAHWAYCGRRLTIGCGWRPGSSRNLIEFAKLVWLPEVGIATVKVKVVPASSRNRVAGWLGGTLKVTVTAPAEGGKANAAVTTTLAEALGLPRAPSASSAARHAAQACRDRGPVKSEIPRLAEVRPNPWSSDPRCCSSGRSGSPSSRLPMRRTAARAVSSPDWRF